MLVSLGFLVAILLGFVLAPAYRRRTVRLTTDKIRRSLPMTEAEIRAAADRLRAEHAIRVHKLEARVDQARRSSAHQRVEINRRDAVVNTLERNTADLTAALEASDNARRVLEQTIMERVPRVESRLVEARRLVGVRDAEMVKLKSDTAKTFRALDEAMQINAQQRSELDKLKSALATRGTRRRSDAANPDFDGEVALRSELEALRTRTRDQASLIERLQDIVRAAGETAGQRQDSDARALAEDGGEEIKKELALAVDELKSAQDPPGDELARLKTEIRSLKIANAAKTEEIEALRAALAEGAEQPALQGPAARLLAGRAKAKRQSSERGPSGKHSDGQNEVIQRLRAELAGANDRLARQAAQFRDELRRLGAGTIPASARSRRQDGLMEEFPGSGDNGTIGDGRATPRQNLAQRISEQVPSAAVELARDPGGNLELATSRSTTPMKHGETPEPEISAPKSTIEPLLPQTSEKPADKADTRAVTGPRRRTGLMDRIASLGKS